MFLPSQLERTPQLPVMVDKVKREGRASPMHTRLADFTSMMECTLESGHCHSVYSVSLTIGGLACMYSMNKTGIWQNLSVTRVNAAS